MVTTNQMYQTLKPKVSKKKIFIILLIILPAAATVFYFIFRDNNDNFSYSTVNPNISNVSSVVNAAGKISATNEVLIGSQVSGTISAVFVEENDVVKKGDVLAVINPDTINQTIARYEAQLNSAKASYNASAVQYNNKKVNYRRLNEVYQATGGKSPSKTELDNAKMELSTAEADMLVRKATILEAETGLNSAKIDLKNSIITSPIDGVVLMKSIDAGQTVAASFSTPELFVIAESLEKMKLVVNVSEADVGKVKEGQRAFFTVDTYPDDIFKSTVYRVNKGSTETDEKIVSYETTIYVDNKDLKLRSGMSAAAEIETAHAEKVLVIPVSALYFKPLAKLSEVEKRPEIFRGPPTRKKREKRVLQSDIKSKNAIVHVLNNNMAEPRDIVTGVSDGKYIEVVSGLTADDKVIISMKREK